MSDRNIENIWNRVVALAGSDFRQIRGKVFTYHIRGNAIVLDTTNRSISKSELAKALSLMPLSSTSAIQHLQAPSYIYAILTDPRVLG